MGLANFDRVYETIPGNGWLSRAEGKMLYKYALMSEGPILEVGCYYGRSTVLLASFGRAVHAVDPFDGFDSTVNGEEIARAFWSNIHNRDIKNVLQYRHRIEDWRPDELPKVGLAYLDGDHTYQGTINQIQKALLCDPKYILVHDVNDSGGGLEVKNGAISLLGNFHERIERLAAWVMI